MLVSGLVVHQTHHNSIDTDVWSPLHGEGLRGTDQPCLGRTIGGRTGRGPDTAHRGDVNHHARSCALSKRRVGLLGQHQGRDQI